MGVVNVLFNPFDTVIKAYESLYSSPCVMEFVEGLHLADGDPWGCTEFAPDCTPRISIDVECPVRGAIEVLAHELAHVAVGDTECEEEGHGFQWYEAFAEINHRYTELVVDDLPDGMEISTPPMDTSGGS